MTTQTYTALTCKLIVSTTGNQQPGVELGSQGQTHSLQQQNSVDFTLELDRSDYGDSDPITLQGNFSQLDLLQQVVSKYITELVAKFPFPDLNNDSTSDSISSTTIDRDLSTPEIDIAGSIGSKLYPNNPQPTQSGLMNNLPGLRNISAQSIGSGDTEDRSNSAAPSGISKLFGGWNKSSGKKSKKTKQKHTPLGAGAGVKSGFGKREVADRSPTTPYLIGNERSLDRQLYLGDLANSSSGDTITLSPIQLFDLSTVLDEYTADEVVTTRQERSVTLSQANIPGHSQDRFIDVDATTVSLSRLPNLPRTATGSVGSQTSEVFNRTRTSRHSRPSVSLLSVLPWAAAAAVVVGVPMLLLDPKPNPLKDATSKVNMPDLEGVKQTVTAAMSPPIVDPEPTNTTTPQQWNEQPVASPQTNIAGSTTPNNPPINTGIQPTQSNSQIGTAPLPSTLEGQPSPALPTTTRIPAQTTRPSILSTLPRNAAQSGIAPNPLSDDRLSSEISNLERSSGKPGLKSGMPSTLGSTTKTTRQPNSNLSPAIKPGTVSVSTQPILLPSDLPGIGIAPNPARSPVNSASAKPRTAVSKTTKSKAKLTPAAKAAQSKSGLPTGVGAVPQPLFEQGTPVPANPNFMDPIQPQTGGENTNLRNLPIVPIQPFPTNTSGNWPSDSIDSPAIQATRSYFQSKWKPSDTQQNALQYVVQVSGKSGLVRSVSAQGAAATTYLNQSKIIKAGQKLVAPVPGGTDQKIRVVLQPDGNVDTFMEP
ncbi:MAG: DUF4335 domain-containing protein [Chamaesiphon sp.]|nr:DUF4335 domain-containing protein [Chamaesiphon sp.]